MDLEVLMHKTDRKLVAFVLGLVFLIEFICWFSFWMDFISFETCLDHLY